MITINKPQIELIGDETFLYANIQDESQDNVFKLFYSVEKNYGEYFSVDRADAFLLASLMIAMKSHQDICVKAPVSKRLLFNINNTIQPLFTKMIPDSCCIKIYAEVGYCEKLDGKAVGCGCSLGVDSFSALYKHMGENVIDSYRLTHLALFNSGQLGYLDSKKSESTFRKAVEDITPFSKEIGLPIVAINTNLNEYFVMSGFRTAVSRFVISTLCCPLAMQKLFGKYVFASSYSVEDFEISQKDQSHAEATYVPLLSTESTEIILSSAVMTRVEKTDFIRKYPYTSKYLDVCWAAQMADSVSHNDKWLKDKTKRNCGWCDKCARTLFTLELLGEDIRKYNDIFDLSKYYEHKEEFIRTVLTHWRSNIMYKEIYFLMKEKKYEIPKSVEKYLKKRRIKAKIRNIFSFTNK